MVDSEIVIIQGIQLGESLRLTADARVIGRTASSDFVVRGDEQVSSRHFEISLQDHRYFVTDLNSRNGTFVNGIRISRQSLQNGDEIKAGRTVFRFRDKFASPIDDGTWRGIPSKVPSVPEPNSGALPVQPEPEPPAEAPASAAEVKESPQSEEHGIPQLRLRVLNGDEEGKICWLSLGQTMSLGRTEMADYSFPNDPAISGVHCVVTFDRNGGTLQDRRSREGTWLNGIRIESEKIYHQDRVRIGITDFLVELSGVPSATRPEKQSLGLNSPRSTIQSPQHSTASLSGSYEKLPHGLWHASGTGPLDSELGVDATQFLNALTRQSIPWYYILDRSRVALPLAEDFPFASSILFDWLPESEGALMPLLVDRRDTDWSIAIEEGWGSDAIVVLVSSLSKDKLLEKMRNQLAPGAEELSPPARISGTCWPSVLKSMLETDPNGFVKGFMEGLEAVFVEDSGDASKWHLYGGGRTLEICKRIGVKLTERSTEEPNVP
jgi:pSer/pThr/pTyr-binding forkhead associated (FHA) protein